MKFQCGECGKFYNINNNNISSKDLVFKCEYCNNQFLIKANSIFSSSNGNSKISCENCGQLINENNEKCESCNLLLNKSHEELRIDNKYYDLLEVSENGKVWNKKSGKNIGKRKILFPICIVIALFVSISAYYFLSKGQNIKRIETQVVIMKTGKTYYADKIERNGDYLKITNKNGIISKIFEKDVLQISKAVIEN